MWGCSKTEVMANLTINKLQYEAQYLKRTLAFILEENVQLKNRLTEVLKGEKFDLDLLEDLEVFQNRFVQQDKMISLLRDDLARMDRSFENDIPGSQTGALLVRKKLQKLLHNIIALESQFCRLRTEFTLYLRENI
jgi:hypothetical protein